ncbi:MAG: putative ABC transporter permease [Lachnospiraceae bacterium]|nr:putative ABC transporter permease [Lachnospiraceae bacterium]
MNTKGMVPMSEYTISQWLFFFYFYCFIGWCYESTYVSIRQQHFVNRGFMRGPFLPLYGSGAIIMLIVSLPFKGNLMMIYIAGCVGATTLEFLTGFVMERLFRMRYWDYSKQYFNCNGYIFLQATLLWGFLTIFMTQYWHKPIERFALAVPAKVMDPMVSVVTLILVIDFTLSFKTALDLRNILLKVSQAKADMLRIKKRLDVLVAVNGEDRQMFKLDLEIKTDELRLLIEERLEQLRAKASNSELLESAIEEFNDLKEKYHINLEIRSRLLNIKDSFQRAMLQGNPYMVSEKFRDTLEDMKEAARKKRNK